MALVADYESDSEENDSCDEYSELPRNIVSDNSNILEKDNKNVKIEERNEKQALENLIHINKSNDTKLDNLFSKLPESKSHNFVESEEQIEDFIPKSALIDKKHKVKISIPSLSDFKDDEDEEPRGKKFKPSKGSGLLSLLPPVKGSVKSVKSFVPNVVANKNKIPINKELKAKPKVQEKEIPNKQKMLAFNKSKKSGLSDAESEDDEFEIPETFDDAMWQKVCGRAKPKPIILEPITTEETVVDLAPEAEKPYDGLDNEAFKELVGKTKRPIGNIKLIDINEEEILSDKDLWLTKSLTDPEMAPKATVEDPVDPTRRKKHHITYLAQQAKANEQELANAWAASKNNRMASRAKYGF